MQLHKFIRGLFGVVEQAPETIKFRGKFQEANDINKEGRMYSPMALDAAIASDAAAKDLDKEIAQSFAAIEYLCKFMALPPDLFKEPEPKDKIVVNNPNVEPKSHWDGISISAYKQLVEEYEKSRTTKDIIIDRILGKDEIDYAGRESKIFRYVVMAGGDFLRPDRCGINLKDLATDIIHPVSKAFIKENSNGIGLPNVLQNGDRLNFRSGRFIFFKSEAAQKESDSIVGVTRYPDYSIKSITFDRLYPVTHPFKIEIKRNQGVLEYSYSSVDAGGRAYDDDYIIGFFENCKSRDLLSEKEATEFQTIFRYFKNVLAGDGIEYEGLI